METRSLHDSIMRTRWMRARSDDQFHRVCLACVRAAAEQRMKGKEFEWEHVVHSFFQPACDCSSASDFCRVATNFLFDGNWITSVHRDVVVVGGGRCCFLRLTDCHSRSHQRNWTKCDTRYAHAFLSGHYHLFTAIFYHCFVLQNIFDTRAGAISPLGKLWNSELCVLLWLLSQSPAVLLFIIYIFNTTFGAKHFLFDNSHSMCSRLWWDGGDNSQSNNASFNFHSFSCDRPPVVCDCTRIAASMSARFSIVHTRQIGATIESRLTISIRENILSSDKCLCIWQHRDWHKNDKIREIQPET